MMYRSVFLALFIAFLTAFSAHADNNPIVRISTNIGNIDIELYPDKAPETVNNFLHYVEQKHFNGTLFHRVIDNFMIQGGGYDTNYEKKSTHEPIINESTNSLSNRRGTIAMARTRNPHSATAQFFINVRDNASLDFAHLPARGSNTLRGSQLGILDPLSGGVTTEDCRGARIQRDTLVKAAASPHDGRHSYICLMQAILHNADYNLDTALSDCLENIEQLKQDNKMQANDTCSSYVSQRHENLQLVYMKWGYAVFGHVIRGMDIVDQIKMTPTGAAGSFTRDAPLDPVIIQTIERLAN